MGVLKKVFVVIALVLMISLASAICISSNKVFDIYSKGEVSFEGKTYTDSCKDGIIFEVGCNKENLIYNFSKCPYNLCDGSFSCLLPNWKLTCSKEFNQITIYSKCDPKKCVNSEFVKCKSIKNIFTGKISYTHVCLGKYETTCMKNPVCRAGYAIKSRTTC